MLVDKETGEPTSATSICAISSCAPARRAEGGALAVGYFTLWVNAHQR